MRRKTKAARDFQKFVDQRMQQIDRAFEREVDRIVRVIRKKTPNAVICSGMGTFYLTQDGVGGETALEEAYNNIVDGVVVEDDPNSPRRMEANRLLRLHRTELFELADIVRIMTDLLGHNPTYTGKYGV